MSFIQVFIVGTLVLASALVSTMMIRDMGREDAHKAMIEQCYRGGAVHLEVDGVIRTFSCDMSGGVGVTMHGQQ